MKFTKDQMTPLKHFLCRIRTKLRSLLGLPYKDYARMSVRIKIDNLTGPQAKAIEDLLHQWELLGNLGSSRWTAFFADGDGNFQPKIKVNGSRPESSGKGKWETVTFKNGAHGCTDDLYLIDFGWIAWAERAALDQTATLAPS